MRSLDDKKGYRIEIATNNVLTHRWNAIEPLLKRALQYSDGKYSLPGIQSLLLNHHAVCWLALENTEIKGVLLTKINEFECSKRASLFMLAGDDLDKLMKLYPTIKNWALRMGCDALELFGRPGWEKKLKKYDFEKTHIVLRATL